MTFELKATDPKSNARAGLITTDHGTIETPIFMPVGTVGSVKAVQLYELKDDVKAQIILGNTYHLYLRPGLDILEKAGGLHKFNGFDRPILTDSGGFQVFSLSGIRKMREEGVEFRSHIDGSKHLFTPERVMDIERTIGADIMMAFDECTPGTAEYDYARSSMERTHRWLDRCWKRFKETEPKYGYSQSLFPIVQGCTYPDLRRQSAEKIASMGADGNAIGTRDWINKFAEYLQPGESTYVYTYTSLDGKTSADVDDYAFTVSGKSDNSSTSVRLPVSTDLAMNVQDGWWTYNYMYATVTNNTEEVIYKIETVLVLQDAEGKPLYMTSETMYDEGLVPGSSVVIRKSIDNDTLEYWQAKGVEPASVDAIAFVTVENK